MVATLDDRTILPLDAPVRADLRKAFDQGQDVCSGQPAGPRGRLVGPDGSAIELPDQAYQVLRRIVEEMASGQAVIVRTTDPLLTTGQAAQFLGVSRPTLVRMLDNGVIPGERTGSHRRVQLADLVAYKERQQLGRQAALDEMAREAAETGLDEETDSLPRGE